MAKKTNRHPPAPRPQAGRPQPAQKPAVAAKDIKPAAANDNFFLRYINIIAPTGIALLTWLFLKTCLNNKFTNWDDPGYIKDNALIKDVSAEGIRNIFSADNPVMGNYHPLTVLSYAIEYSYVRLEPWLYHLDSLLMHIVVTLLVYWFVNILTHRRIAAVVAALLFGLHPMHMESVAWLAGRKDVVYGMFYMGACVAYVYYARAATMNRKLAMYLLVLLLYTGALLGKPVAVVLPLTLLLIDYFLRRPLKVVLLAEKVPHFVLAIVCGLKSMKDQHAFLSLETQDVTFNFVQRIALGGYAFVTYLWKAVVPAGLCNFYPYPEKVNGVFPPQYFVYPVIALAILAAVAFAWKKRMIVFGSLFFLVNIALLLQFIPVGSAIVADRYSYIAYLGLFIMAGWYLSEFFEKGGNRRIGQIVAGGAAAYILVLGYLSNERCQVWYDTTSLWRDEIEKEPRTPNAWNNLGFNYFNKFNDEVNPQEKKIYYDSAYYLLQKAIELQPAFANPYISIGELQRSVGKFPEAKVNYYRALKIGTTNEESANAYLGLGIIYAITHNFDSSWYCFNTAITLKPYFPEAHGNFGNFYDMIGKPDSALKQYQASIDQNPDMFAPHLNRGRLLQKMHRCDEAMKDFAAALQLVPENGEVYYARSFCFAQKGDRAHALQDVEKAMSLGFTNVNREYYESMKRQ